MVAAAAAEAFELEAKRRDDGSWHPCRVSLSSNNASFGISLSFECCDEEDIISSREDMIGRLRFRSNHLQDGECFHLRVGENVLVAQTRSSYFDAVIAKAYRVRHSGRLQCRCTFEVKWLTAKLKGLTMTVPSESIMKLSDKNIDSHPVIASFLAALKPLNDVKVPSFLGSVEDKEDTTCEANIHGELEKQVDEICKLADRSECSKEEILRFKQANSSRRRSNIITSDTVTLKNQGDSRRITRSQTKEQANVEFVKHLDDVPLLSPLAARAALAFLMHGQLSEKKESPIFQLQDDLLDLYPEDEEKHNYGQYLEVEHSAVQSDTCSMNDVIEPPTLAQESTNDRLVEDWGLTSSITTSRRDSKKSPSEESLYSFTSRKKSTRASRELENGNLISCITVNHSIKSATKEKLNGGGVFARSTRSSAQKQILESTEKQSLNENFATPVKTRLTRSGRQIARRVIDFDQEIGDSNQIKEIEDHGTTEKNESNKRELVSTSIETSADRAKETKRRTRKSSVEFTEDDPGVISQGGAISQAKKEKLSPKKPVLRFSPRLSSCPRTRPQT